MRIVGRLFAHLGEDGQPAATIMGNQAVRLVGLGAATTIAYIIAAHVGFRLAFVAEQITTVWAPTGIALAALLLCGLRLWPAVWFGAFFANIGTDAPLWTAFVIATGNTLEAVAAVWGISRLRHFDPGLNRVTDVLVFIAIGGVVCTMVSATTGVATLSVAGVQPWDRFGTLWLDWWLGDALGAIVVAPAILTTVRESWSPGHAAKASTFVLGAAIVTYLIFSLPFGLGIHPLEFIVFPVVVAAAVVGRPSVTSLVVLAASAVAISQTVRGAGPFAGPDVHHSLVLLQVFISVLGATAMLLAAAIAERRMTELRAKNAAAGLQEAKTAAEEGQQQLADANRELRRRVLEQQTLLDVLPIGIGIAEDRECRHIHTNRAFAATLGLPPNANASKTAPAEQRPTNFRVLTPDGKEVSGEQLPLQTAAREGREVHEVEFDIVHDDGRVVRLLEYASPLFDEHGTPRGAVGAFVDVTAAHRARATLARSEGRYRHIFDTAGVSIWEQDFSAVVAALDRLQKDGVEDIERYLASHPAFVETCVRLVKIVDVNAATLRMFGATEKGELLVSLERIFGPETGQVFADELLAIARGDRRFEAEGAVRTLDGRTLYVLVSIAFPAPGESFESVLVSLADITDRKQAETALRQEVEVRTTLAHVGASLAGELRSDKLIHAITDAATKLTEAEFGAFFYNVTDDNGDSYSLYSLAGAPREAFASFPHPRATQIFGPTFRGDSVIRLDDVTKDPRFGRNAPFHGVPEGHLPVRSYLAVPVIGRDGIVLGGLFFGHSRPAVFTERHELLAAGVGGWAAIALDNARLYEALEDANRLKDEFLATLSHELRTPLNAVLGWAHMLREGTMEPSMRQKALESLERNARAQAQLVEDLLDVSRIMAGKLPIKADPVDLGAVVANAVDTVRAGVSAKRLNLRVQLPTDGRMIVTGDADRLQQIVWNLVSNAIKFTPSGGQVDVELRRVDSLAEIVVRDTGQGIDPSFRPLLFQRFQQLDASKTRLHGGLGLGLSIVRHLTEAHGGTVTAESQGLGHGSTFRVRLPVRVIDDTVHETLPAAGLTTDFDLSGVSALVVDDDEDARVLVRYVLESRGAQVVTASSAGEALHVLTHGRFDVLIADIGMPEQDGLALIRLVRGLPAPSSNNAIPAIAVTAYANARERDEALEAGFGWHLGKPVDPDQLIVSVAMATGGAPPPHD